MGSFAVISQGTADEPEAAAEEPAGDITEVRVAVEEAWATIDAYAYTFESDQSAETAWERGDRR